jgi:plastocyanin
MRPRVRVASLALVVLAAASLAATSTLWASGGHDRGTRQVTVPTEDRFTPYAVTIHAGDSVKWVNTDTDAHTVVSDDAFNTAGNQGTDRPLPSGGSVTLRFTHPGTFVYYCRFHAHLDAFNQPAAPGPKGGIQDPSGNLGTPMTGIVTVLPGDRHGDQQQGG